MSPAADSVLAAALQLSEEERMSIVARLLETLPEDQDGPDLDDPEFIKEMDRRAADLEGSLDWSQVRDME